MITFDYYKETFRGKLNETQFNDFKDEAIMVYENYTLKPKLTQKLLDENGKGAKAIKFSICTIIDNLQRADDLKALSQTHDERVAKGIKSEKVTSHSVTYSDKATTSDIERDLDQSNQRVMRKYLLAYGLLYRGIRHV